MKRKIIVIIDDKYTKSEYDYLLNEIKKTVVKYNSFAVNSAEVKEV